MLLGRTITVKRKYPFFQVPQYLFICKKWITLVLEKYTEGGVFLWFSFSITLMTFYVGVEILYSDLTCRDSRCKVSLTLGVGSSRTKVYYGRGILQGTKKWDINLRSKVLTINNIE